MTLVASDIDYLRTIVSERSGNVVSANQGYLFEARLSPIAKSAGLKDVKELVHVLRTKSTSPLHEKVTEAMTINETSFFRDMQPFDALKDDILPQLIPKRNATKSLSIWSAASSSGQEAYSIAILIRSEFPELNDWDVRVLGTDYSDEMVQRTREGRYSQFEVNRGLPSAMLVSSFDRDGLSWLAKPQLRKMINARKMNLTEKWPSITKHDVVFLRNVLIYFDVETKVQVLRNISESMRPDGFLFLGGGETLIRMDVPFERVSVGNTVAYRPLK